MELVPEGVELQGLRALVADDLVGDEELVALVGRQHVTGEEPVLGATEIPRVRPILVALAARATGADEVEGEAQYAAELLHVALAVHDVALGRERGGLRRRVARRLVRRSVSWFSGNHLILRALELSRHSRPEILEDLVDALRSFSDAQALSRELLGEVPEADDWEDHADAHTGALFAFCCRAGAHLAGAEPALVSALGRYGRHVGRLWHVAEDVSALDHGDDPAAHLALRALSGRPALPVVIAAARDPGVGERWARLSRGAAREAEPLVERVAQLGLPRAREALVQESWRARKALRVLPDTRYRAAMDKLAEGIARAGVRRAAEEPPA